MNCEELDSDRHIPIMKTSTCQSSPTASAKALAKLIIWTVPFSWIILPGEPQKAPQLELKMGMTKRNEIPNRCGMLCDPCSFPRNQCGQWGREELQQRMTRMTRITPPRLILIAIGSHAALNIMSLWLRIHEYWTQGTTRGPMRHLLNIPQHPLTFEHLRTASVFFTCFFRDSSTHRTPSYSKCWRDDRSEKSMAVNEVINSASSGSPNSVALHGMQE